MDQQKILTKLLDLRDRGLSNDIYNQLVKMVEGDLIDGNVIFPYLDAVYDNGLLSDDVYNQLQELFFDLTDDDLDEVPFY